MLRTLSLLLALSLLCPAQAVRKLPWLASPTALAGLPALELRPDGDAPAGGQVLLRWAADADALHLRVTSAQPGLACRDRAYQNGDGLILVLATPEPGDAPSRRFRVLGFSPQAEGQRSWQYAFTWYRDVDLQMTPLTGVQFAWEQSAGTVTFTLRLPWTALAPYHPLLTPELGLNLCYVRAEGEGSRSFSLVQDPAIQMEQHPRSYARFHCEPPPAALAGQAWFAQLQSGHPEQGSAPRLLVAAAEPQQLQLRILEGEGESLACPPSILSVAASSSPQALPLPVPGLPCGAYQVQIQGPGRNLTWGLSVLPQGGTAALGERLRRLPPGVAPGTASTLAFQVQAAASLEAQLAPGDPAPALRRALQAVDADLRALEAGRDPIATRVGLLRRGFRSALDDSLQPYSIRVPEGAAARPRPLLVFLHGSGQDDRKVLDSPRAPAGWFELAPFGRGTSNCFSADRAQDDLREAIQDALANYPIDPARIFLAGFSMGGYGVYRTAFERPGFFKGLAVFSGVPDLASRWLGPGHPDFLGDAELACFKGMPVFVFHGTQDRNCPFAKTQQMVGRLERAGAAVTFVVEDGKGHEAPGAASLAQYFHWLERASR